MPGPRSHPAVAGLPQVAQKKPANLRCELCGWRLSKEERNARYLRRFSGNTPASLCSVIPPLKRLKFSVLPKTASICYNVRSQTPGLLFSFAWWWDWFVFVFVLNALLRSELQLLHVTALYICYKWSLFILYVDFKVLLICTVFVGEGWFYA